MICPKCGSWKIVYTGLGFKELTYRCNECGHNFSKTRKELGEYSEQRNIKNNK